MNDDSVTELLPVLHAVESWRDSCIPATIEAHGPAARFAWEEFFRGEIRNEYTRRNYLHAVRRFLTWTEERGIELPRIAPAHVGAYLDESTASAPTKKLHLAAIRAFFDRLVLRHVVVLNPAQSVRGPRHATVEGRTPEIGPAQVRQLLDSIGSADVVACRDRALIATLVYTAARVGDPRNSFHRGGDMGLTRQPARQTLGSGMVIRSLSRPVRAAGSRVSGWPWLGQQLGP